MYYAGIVYYLLQDGTGPRFWLGDATQITPLNIISNITFLHGINPYWITSIVPGGWTITVEMMFYLLLPFLFSRIKNLKQALNFFILSLLFKFAIQEILFKFPLIGHERLWLSYLNFYFPSQLPVFALGIIMYYLICERGETIKIPWKPLLVLCLIIIASLAFNTPQIFPHHILFGIAFLVLGVILAKYPVRPIVNTLVCYIGKISFSMYLVHFAVLYWLAEFNLVDFFSNGVLNYCTRFFIVCLLTVMVSSITYRLIELPSQNYVRNLITGLERKFPEIEKKKVRLK